MNKITRSNGNILIKLDNGTIIRSIPTDPYGDDKLTCIGKVVITNKEINLRQILIPDTLYDNCYFGYSVDVTKDGNILAIGAPGHFVNNDKAAGAVYIYKFLNDSYQLFKVMHSNIRHANGYFGAALDISEDTNSIKISCLSIDLTLNKKSKLCRTEKFRLDTTEYFTYMSLCNTLKYNRLDL